MNDVSFIETSAMDNTNVEYAFETLISKMYANTLYNKVMHTITNTMEGVLKFKSSEGDRIM